MLFDHLVGQRQHRRWNFETDRFRSLEVEHKQITRRLFERKIGGLRSLEDTINHGGGAFERFSQVRPIGHQAALANQRLSLIHISEPTRLGMISYAVFCLKKK